MIVKLVASRFLLGVNDMVNLHMSDLILMMDFSSYSILSAITLNDMLDCAIIEGAFNAVSFTEFIARVVECAESEFVLVMNNCAIHKSQEVRDIIKAR